MAVILNIETSTEVCSVALSKDGKLLYEREILDGLNHSELLTVFIKQLFDENNLSMQMLDAVAVSKGPGSYTGLRIGVSVAKGLCYALDIPLISVGSLDSLGTYVAESDEIKNPTADGNVIYCPMIDARRMEVYTALYDNNGNSIKSVSAEIIDDNSFSELLGDHTIYFFGNGAEKCRDHLRHKNAIFQGPIKTSARFMQKLSDIKYNKREFEDVAYFEPFYLKDFVATIPRNKILE